MNEGKISEETFKLCEIGRQEALGYFDQYWKHSTALRNWFVVYGVGALALVVTHDSLFPQITAKKILIGSIIVGIALQILLALLNKIVHWYVFWGKNLKKFQDTKCYRKCKWISEKFEIDITIDVLTIIAYGVACAAFVYSLFQQ